MRIALHTADWFVDCAIWRINVRAAKLNKIAVEIIQVCKAVINITTVRKKVLRAAGIAPNFLAAKVCLVKIMMLGLGLLLNLYVPVAKKS